MGFEWKECNRLMRTMLLSFKADVYERVVAGEKIYEHRRVFPDDPIEAYLYVSAPKKVITGIMRLSHKVEIESWKALYSYDKAALARIEEYLKHHKYAMQIDDFQPTTEIPLSKLRIDLPGFTVPQMYYFIDGSDLHSYLRSNLHKTGQRIIHEFDTVDSSQICKL